MTLVGGSQGAARAARLLNLGLGGACVEVEAPHTYSVGDAIALEISAPSLWDPLLLRSRIAWLEPPGRGTVRAGLAFDHGGDQALPALVELLTGHCPE